MNKSEKVINEALGQVIKPSYGSPYYVTERDLMPYSEKLQNAIRRTVNQMEDGADEQETMTNNIAYYKLANKDLRQYFEFMDKKLGISYE